MDFARAAVVLRFCRVQKKSVAITTQMMAATQTQGIPEG
jgi:hypothetical protein